MAKKKAKISTKSKSSAKSHGELFDKHNNLKWLLPIFFIIAAVAVVAIKNASSGSPIEATPTTYQIPQSTTTVAPTGSSLGY